MHRILHVKAYLEDIILLFIDANHFVEEKTLKSFNKPEVDLLEILEVLRGCAKQLVYLAECFVAKLIKKRRLLSV